MTLTLSPREKQVLSLLIDRPASHKVTAREMGISVGTLKFYMTNLLLKTGHQSRTALLAHIVRELSSDIERELLCELSFLRADQRKPPAVRPVQEIPTTSRGDPYPWSGRTRAPSCQRSISASGRKPLLLGMATGARSAGRSEDE